MPESTQGISSFPDVRVKYLKPETDAKDRWPTVKRLRELADNSLPLAITLNTNPVSVEAILQSLEDLRADLPSVIVCSVEPIPADLRAALPASLHLLASRPQPTDLVFVTAEAFRDASGDESLLEMAIRLGAIRLKTTKNTAAADRFPEAGPGKPAISINVLQGSIRQTLGELALKSMERKCVESGLLLLWDFLETSHEISQTLEGKGSPRTADYWHGIMHRREPDAGNASYWFRRVGAHPALDQLGAGVTAWMNELGATSEQVKLASDRLLRHGTFDPFAMIEFSRVALDHSRREENFTFRMVQYLEILNLLAWSFRQM